MKPIRLGIVGPGLIWENVHRGVLAQLGEDYAIAAFCASSEASRAKVERDYPGTPFFSDYRELAHSPLVDALVVLTPIPLNAPVTLAALQAGKDVFLEKPMAHTAEEGMAILRAVQETQRRVFVLEQQGYRASVTTALEVLHSGAIGDLVLYDKVSHILFDAGAHSVRGYGTTAWRIHADFPLGTLFDGGHHHIAQLSALFGLPQAVTAYGRSLRPEYGDYDHVLMLFEYADALRGVFSHSNYLGGARSYFHIRGSGGLMTVERDRLVLQNREGIERTIEIPPENAHHCMWTSFVRCLREGIEPAYTLDHAWQDLRTLLAIDRALREGGRVRITSGGPQR